MSYGACLGESSFGTPSALPQHEDTATRSMLLHSHACLHVHTHTQGRNPGGPAPHPQCQFLTGFLHVSADGRQEEAECKELQVRSQVATSLASLVLSSTLHKVAGWSHYQLCLIPSHLVPGSGSASWTYEAIQDACSRDPILFSCPSTAILNFLVVF